MFIFMVEILNLLVVKFYFSTTFSTDIASP